MVSDSVNDLFQLYPAKMYFLSYLTLPSTDRTSVFFLIISISGERGALLLRIAILVAVLTPLGPFECEWGDSTPPRCLFLSM